MQFKRFGRTELQIPVFSFGAMRIPDGDEENAVATVKAAVDAGINHLETARGYGTSEELLKLAFQEINRDEVMITTKIGPEDTADDMRRMIDESLERMGVSKIENFDVHGINTTEILAKTIKKNGAMDGVRAAMKDGLIDHVGFSTHGPLDVILDAINTEEFESVNLHYFFFNRRNEPAVRRARELDMGVYIISPTDKGGQLFNPPPFLRELTSPMSPIQLNDRWLLADPDVHTLSLGAAVPSDLDEHMTVADNIAPLSDVEKEIVGRIENTIAERLGTTLCTGCYDCLPCPEDINIPVMLSLRNMARGLDMVEFGKFRYNLFSNGGHWFPGEQATVCTDCGDCLPRCPEKLEIPRLLRDTHALLLGESQQHLYARND
jgi:uncharacterized protein